MERRNTVFQQMEKAGYLTEREVDSLSRLPIKTSSTAWTTSRV